MLMNESNFLYAIKQIVTGLNGDSITDSGTAGSNDGGVQRDVPLAINDIVVLQSGSTAKLSTITSLTAMPVIETAAAASPNIGFVSIQIPRDYDEASDKFQLRLNVVLANADASITLTGTPTILIPGSVPSATDPVTKTAVTATLPFTTTNASLSQTVQTVEIQLNGYGLLRDNVISVELAYAGTISGVGDIVSLQYKYDSTIVSYNETDTSDAPGGTLTGFGNILR